MLQGRRDFGMTCLLTLFAYGCAPCTPVNLRDTPIELVFFRQALLREAADDLSTLSGVPVLLSDEVRSMDGLYVDLPEQNHKTIGQVLDAVIAFVQTEHRISLKVVPDGRALRITPLLTLQRSSLPE